MTQFYIQQDVLEGGKPGLFRACYGSIQFGTSGSYEGARNLINQVSAQPGLVVMLEERDHDHNANMAWFSKRFWNEGGGRALIVVPDRRGEGQGWL